MDQPPTKAEWFAMRNQPDYRVVRRDAMGYSQQPKRSSIPISEEALALQVQDLTRRLQMRECELCCEWFGPDGFTPLINCEHRYCESCITKHCAISVTENRVQVPCPGCTSEIHPNDIHNILAHRPILVDRYETLTVLAVLKSTPGACWCPSPDCGFAMIVPQGARCPRVECPSPECNAVFCYKCNELWHKGNCKPRSLARLQGAESPCRPCPRCQTLIMKENDGSCNHMHCSMCKAEFCWLCLKEVTDFHYMSPTGCTFWGKKMWTPKKKLMWQLGTLLGTPAVVVATAVVSVPLIIGLVPWSIGKKVYRKMKNESKAKRVISTAAAVTGSAIVSPALAGVAVVLGAPLAIGYTYIVVPKALIRDFKDYMARKNDTGITEITGEQLLKLSVDEDAEKKASTVSLAGVIDRNADGSAPGPSSGASVTSSDYSEDFDSSDYVELTDTS